MNAIWKNKKAIINNVLLGLIVSSVLAGVAIAEEQTTYKLEDMVVTATKTERSVKDVSTNMVVLTKEDIETYQPTDVMDLLRHVPGLVLNGLGGTKTSFYAGARGIQPSSRGMLIMMDGVEMNDPSNYLSVTNIPLNTIERIEVMKTPGSALYGPAAVGGIIHIITKKPTQPNETAADITYGSFDTKEIGANTAGILQSGFSYGLNYRYLDTDGYRDNNFRRYHGFTPRLGFTTENLDVQLLSNIIDSEYGFPGGLPLSTYKDDPEASLQPDREGDSVTSATGATMRWTINQQTILNAKATYRTNDWETEDYGFLFKGDDYNIATAEINGSYNTSIANMDNTFLLGTEYRDLHNEPKMYMDDNFGGALLSSAEISENIWGFFVQDELRPTENFMVNLGVRYDDIQTDFENKLSAASNYENSHDKWSPRLGLSYVFFPELNVFANYSEGIRSVNLARPAFQLRENVGPEKEASFEIGCRGMLFDLVTYNVAGFQTTTEDKIIRESLYVYSNAGEARSRGVEAEAGVTLASGIYGSINYTYLHSEYTDYQTETANYNDKRVPLVPRHMAGATLGWQNPTYGNISGSLRYVSDKYIDDANTLELDGYTVMDMKYIYTLKNLFGEQNDVRFSVAVNNVFDETYAEYGESSGGMYVAGPVAFPADGRAFFVSIGTSF